jgi:acetoin utilization deacetylase AcuC-like enzyme
MNNSLFPVAFCTNYVHPLPENHRFPMEKYALLPQQLLHEGTLEEQDFFEPTELSNQWLEEVHHKEYIQRLFGLELSTREQKVTGFVHNRDLIHRERLIMEGTRSCAEKALISGVSMNVAGGTHHAFADRGEGFCLLNDQAIAINWLFQATNIKKVLVIDLDVHQGNGTASIFHGYENVFTFSMHAENNYPLKKEQSDLDIPLPDGTNDSSYLFALKKALDNILNRFSPEFIFYQCGVDVLQTDKLGRLALTRNGCRERDLTVFELVKQLSVPVVCSMGGGYSPNIADIIEAHANTFRVARSLFS